MPEVDFNNKGNLVLFGVPGDKGPKEILIGSPDAHKILAALAERLGVSKISEAERVLENTGPIEL